MIDFAQPAKDVFFLWGTDRTYLNGTIEIYDENLQLVNTVAFTIPAYWIYFQGNNYHQRIKRLVLRRPNGSYAGGTGHIWLDNVQFTPITTVSPVGNLEDVSIQDAAAVGWAADPDSPSANIFVDCFIDGQFASRVTANIAGTGGPYPGNHRFSMPIPTIYRDGLDHQISCTGIDVTGGDPNKVLAGSPRTFNIPTALISTTFVPLTVGALSLNNNPGGGLRMFPERLTPTGPINNVVNVKAKIGVNVANVPVYFKSHDLDDPSAAGPPIDVDVAGQDNRAPGATGIFRCVPPGCGFNSQCLCYYALTDANGEAVIPFELAQAHPGDNYAISSTTNVSEPPQVMVEGISLRNSVTGQVLQENVNRTPMLTAWRTLHIERDSMGIIANEAQTNVANEQVIRMRPVNVPVLSTLDAGRFQNGRMRIEDSKVLLITDNTDTTVNVRFLNGIAKVQPGFLYKLCDDDDFNSDTYLNGFDCDHGEDVEPLPDTYNLLQGNDDSDCSNGLCNVFAAAYIQPKYSWGDQFTTSNVTYKQNVNNIFSQIDEQINLGRNLNSGENDEFWVAYVQIAYQYALDRDCDPNESPCSSGVTTGSIYDVNDVANESQVPTGATGSLAFIEMMRDGNTLANELRLRTCTT